ncbi:MAG: CRTAC1 family protein, partial [Planctomycetota bacterium]
MSTANRLLPLHLVVLLGAAGCGSGAPPAAGDGDGAAAAREPAPPAHRPIRFTDKTADSGIELVTVSGSMPSQHILEVNGGGVGLIDFDDDGDLDVFVANGATLADPEAGPGSRLFENLGALTFRDVTEDVGIDLRRWAMGVAVGDADGDGRDDLYVTCYGPNVLFRNTGRRSFEDVTATAGVGDDRWGSSAAFGDLDGDGDLDLYVVNYLEFDHRNPPGRDRYKGVRVMGGPHGLTPSSDVLYENTGGGEFREVTAEAGVLPADPAFGLNLAIIDMDDDGRQDIFVGNDSMANFLFHNTGGLRFEPRGLRSGIAANRDGSMQATMGIGIADVDGNGFPDVFTTNFSSDTNTLHLNIDGKFFDDRTQALGLGIVSRTFLGWACGFFDFDHDGDEDLLVFNGHVYPEASLQSMDTPYEQSPLLFARDGRRFRRVDADEAGPWLAAAHRDRTAAFGDLDRDGDVDVIVGELNGPIRVLRNDAGAAGDGSWLVVRFVDDRPGSKNRRGLGARLELQAGDTTMRRWIFTGGGFQSSSAPEAH